MKDSVAKTWVYWNEHFQKDFFKEYFQTTECQIIVVENQNVGIAAFNKNNLCVNTTHENNKS